MFQTKHGESKLNKMYKPPWRFRGETITAGKARATDNWGRIRKKNIPWRRYHLMLAYMLSKSTENALFEKGP